MVGTEGFEDKLNQILSDPDSMAKIMNLAQSLGGPSAAPNGPPDPPPKPPPPPPDDAFVKGILRLMQQAQHTDKRQEALLCALRIAKLSQLAGFALKNYGGFPGKGEKNV